MQPSTVSEIDMMNTNEKLPGAFLMGTSTSLKPDLPRLKLLSSACSRGHLIIAKVSSLHLHLLSSLKLHGHQDRIKSTGSKNGIASRCRRRTTFKPGTDPRLQSTMTLPSISLPQVLNRSYHQYRIPCLRRLLLHQETRARYMDQCQTIREFLMRSLNLSFEP